MQPPPPTAAAWCYASFLTRKVNASVPSSGPLQLQEIVNARLNNEEKLLYAFYITDEGLVEHVGTYLQEKKVSVERTVQIVYQPQALFRIRPVNRCSATIAGL